MAFYTMSVNSVLAVECVYVVDGFCVRVSVCYVFFFQAEDGIRDLVRSRGLGDVYKRQPVRDAVDSEIIVPIPPESYV